MGQYQRSLMLGFTEHYMFDRPISRGFTVFSTLYKFNQAQQAAQLTGQQVSINPQFIQDYNQNSTGFTTFANYALKKHVFTRVGLTYGLTRTNISTFNQSSALLFESLQFGSLAGPSALNGIIASTVTGTISYNTIDNPINATHGTSYFYSMSFTGGPIGGNVNTITNTGEFKDFHPINHRRNAVGVRFLGGFTTGYGGEEKKPPARASLPAENPPPRHPIPPPPPASSLPP